MTTQNRFDRARKRFRLLPPRIQIAIEWLVILIFSLVLVLFTREWLRFALLPFLLVLFLRIADRVPIIGPAWRWLFGSRSLWDWLTLLFIPMALAVVGLQISAIFNAQRSDGEIEKTRFEATERYLTHLASDTVLPLRPDVSSQGETKTTADSSGTAANQGKRGCGPSRPEGVTASSLTLALANSLTHLRKSSQGDKQVQKKIILEYLNNRKLIRNGSNVISLEHADMSSGDFYYANLTNACLNNIMFADSIPSPDSASDFRFANLSDSDLSGSNLGRANLRNAKLIGSDLTRSTSLFEADLRGADLTSAKLDKTTSMSRAIYNTETIPLDQDKTRLLGFLLCGLRMRIIDTSRICIDPKDYAELKPTRFPAEFYVENPVTKKKEVSKERMKALVYLEKPMQKRNVLP